MDSPETPEALEARVEQAYAAYTAAMGGVDAGHLPLAPYHDLHDIHKGAWRQAVMAALTATPAPPAEEPAPEPVATPEPEPDEPTDDAPRGTARPQVSLTLAPLVPSVPGTRPGHRPGALLLLCQCCRERPQILAEASAGKLIIEARRFGERHYVVLGPDLCERLDGAGKIWCACCDPETEPGRILAECQDGYLIIRALRHGRIHFVVLERIRLAHLLASVTGTA